MKTVNQNAFLFDVNYLVCRRALSPRRRAEQAAKQWLLVEQLATRTHDGLPAYFCRDHADNLHLIKQDTIVRMRAYTSALESV